jgi:hypothetical protein
LLANGFSMRVALPTSLVKDRAGALRYSASASRAKLGGERLEFGAVSSRLAEGRKDEGHASRAKRIGRSRIARVVRKRRHKTRLDVCAAILRDGAVNK